MYPKWGVINITRWTSVLQHVGDAITLSQYYDLNEKIKVKLIRNNHNKITRKSRSTTFSSLPKGGAECFFSEIVFIPLCRRKQGWG